MDLDVNKLVEEALEGVVSVSLTRREWMIVSTALRLAREQGIKHDALDDLIASVESQGMSVKGMIQ